MTRPELEEKLQDLALAQMDARFRAQKVAKWASHADSVKDEIEKRMARDADRAARADLQAIETELASVKAELSRREKLSTRPVVLNRLTEARKLVGQRNQIAQRVQDALDHLAEGLTQLDETTDKLHRLERERDPTSRGHAPCIMHMNPTYRHSRLRHPLWMTFKRSVYRGLVQRFDLPHLAPADFAVAEQRAGAVLLAQWEEDLRQIDELEQGKERSA